MNTSRKTCSETEGPAIGIDLGTTYSCVAVYYNGKVIIIPNHEQGSELTTPSYVFLDTDGDEIIGATAKSNAYRHLDNTIYDVKRILGREFSNRELQNDMKFWPFTVQRGEEDIPMLKVNGERLNPEEISARLLTKLRSFAEKHLQLKPGTIKKAVITVPAYFHDGQRQATIDAGELAGLEVLTILNEPTAAAIAYSMERLNTRKKKILVYDLGGGTFDVAVLNMGADKIEVLCVSGDTHLGGEDMDKKIMEFCLSRFKSEKGVDLLQLKDSTDNAVNKKAKLSLRRLQTYCETAKKYLTSGVTAKVSIDAFYDGEDFVVNLTRYQIKGMNQKLEVAVPKVQSEDPPTENKIEVLGVNGDSHLGGEDFDRKLMEHCLSQFTTETGMDLLQLKFSTDRIVRDKAKRSIRRLQTYCEIAKKDLTSGVKATVSIDGFYGGEDMVVNLKRHQFEEMNKTYFEKTIELVDATLKELAAIKE